MLHPTNLQTLLTGESRNAPTANGDINCEEAGNYPIYDPENPDHNTACRSPKNSRRSRSWSPLKEQVHKGKMSLRSKSPSPTRIMTSSRKALEEFTNTVKLKTAGIRPITPPGLLRDASSMGKDSEKSLKSKSVHWRSSDSTTVVTRDHHKSSPKDIEKASPPLLPDIGYSDHFLGSAVALTARPPPTPVLAALDQTNQKSQVIELHRPVLAETEQPPLPTPMPGTNLPLEDPFDDQAAIPATEFNIFEDPVSSSEDSDASPESVPNLEILLNVDPSSVAKLPSPQFLEPNPMSRASSKTYDADYDDSTLEDTDIDTNALVPVHPKPLNMRRLGDRRSEGEMIDQIVQELEEEIPEIRVSSPIDDNAPKGQLGILQPTTEVTSAVSLGSVLDDSDKENHFPEQGQSEFEAQVESGTEYLVCHHGCRLPSLTEPVKLDASSPDSPPRQPPVAHLTTARKLPPFQLQANITSTSPPRETHAFRYTDSSDEQPMDIVDEISTTEYSWQSHNTLDVKDERNRTPSPACVPLPETPMVRNS